MFCEKTDVAKKTDVASESDVRLFDYFIWREVEKTDVAYAPTSVFFDIRLFDYLLTLGGGVGGAFGDVRLFVTSVLFSRPTTSVFFKKTDVGKDGRRKGRTSPGRIFKKMDVDVRLFAKVTR